MSRKQICQIIGDPVAQSLSPHLHNGAYERLGIADQFFYEAEQVKDDELVNHMQQVRERGIRGLSVTIPHKINVMKLLDNVDNLAQKIGAVNTVVNGGGVLTGYNTDAQGVIGPFATRTDLANKQALVIGSGGAARAAVFSLVDAGADVWVSNRTAEKAQELAEAAGANAYDFDQLDDISQFGIIFNATSVGMSPNEGASPLPPGAVNENQIVFDAVYKPLQTKLLHEAKAAGAETITGLEMLAHQAVGQIKLFTNQEVEPEFILKLLEEKTSE